MKLVDRKNSCGPHETESIVRERGDARPVMVRLHPHYLELRLKGCRRTIGVPYDAVYWHAAKLAVDADRRQKLLAKKSRA
jgi:hypothetical protein